MNASHIFLSYLRSMLLYSFCTTDEPGIEHFAGSVWDVMFPA